MENYSSPSSVHTRNLREKERQVQHWVCHLGHNYAGSPQFGLTYCCIVLWYVVQCLHQLGYLGPWAEILWQRGKLSLQIIFNSLLFCCPGVASNVESARNFNIANHQAARGGSHFAVKSNIHQVPTKCCHQSLETKMFRI